MNAWFRFYHEFSTDTKVQSMPEHMQRRLVMLFCLQGKGELEKLSRDEIAFALRLDGETLHETFHLFQEKGFIDQKGCLLNWDKRQYKSDTSTDRVKKYRDKTKAKKNETGVKRFSNGNVTPPDTDSDTDTDSSSKIIDRSESYSEDPATTRAAAAPLAEVKFSEGDHPATAYIRAFDDAGRESFGNLWMRMAPAGSDFSTGCQLQIAGADVSEYRSFVAFRMSQMAANGKSAPRSLSFFSNAWAEHTTGTAGASQTIALTAQDEAEYLATMAEMEAIRNRSKGQPA